MPTIKFQKGHTLTVGSKNAMYGTKRPQYVCDAIAKANRERTWTPEMREKQCKWFKGVKQKAESVKKRIVRGKNHYRWAGGKTPENEKIRASLEYKKWRTSVFEKDNYTCQECGIRNHNGLGKTIRLEAHHIKQFAFHPELRFDVLNGITLCFPCHSKKREGRPPKKKNESFA